MSEQSTERPSAEQLRGLTTEEAMRTAAELDGVHLVIREDRFPIPGTKAEKRAERAVALSFALAGLAGIAFIVCFIVVPQKWHLPGTPQNFRFYTPLLGITAGIMLLAFGTAIILWAKLVMPHEVAVQDRHDEPPAEEEQLMTGATLVSGAADTGLPRRSLILRSIMFAGGALATVPLVALLGAMIKNPKDELHHTYFRRTKKTEELFPETQGRVPLVYDDWRRVSPGDIQPGGLATVFPGVREEYLDGKDGVHSASSPTLLIRLRPGQKVKSRKGQADYGWPKENPEYLAFSKICTHAGCPASLYEQQTTRLLCPCHQSQFEVLEDAKPVFGPATRALPKLPLDVVEVDGVQYFVARDDFPEPIGPNYWDRKPAKKKGGAE